MFVGWFGGWLPARVCGGLLTAFLIFPRRTSPGVNAGREGENTLPIGRYEDKIFPCISACTIF